MTSAPDDMAAAHSSEPAAAASPWANRLAALRSAMVKESLDGWLVPRADEHQGEYVPPSAERLRWLTGFDGSAGLAIVLMDRAAIFVDGRYTLQVRDQVDTALYAPRHLTEGPPADWLKEVATPGQRIGYDPWLHTPDGLKRLAKGAEAAKAELVPIDGNLVDRIWSGRPPPPADPFIPHPMEFAGETSAEKRAAIAEGLAEQGADAAVLSLPDSIAWLLNIRGSDVPRTPFPLAFALLFADGRVSLFAPEGKVDDALRAHLGEEVDVLAPSAFGPALDALAGRQVIADAGSAPAWVFDRLEAAGATVLRQADPCQLPKSRKNEAEIAGARAAHLRDGVALTRFLHWVDGAAASGLSEMEAASRLEAFRRESNLLRDLSFDTISGAGPNGAIVHYRVTPETDRKLEPGSLFLVDSGGQYPDGTTDVTRTVAIGAPTDDMRRHYTLVLQGHIALATARFPEGTTGSQLDALARTPLWQAGLDYDHGTGHGVGSYLSVHEGPQRISKIGNSVALAPGMIVSNEPGYYLEGAYGIRIENLVAVQTDDRPADRPMLCFETLTLAPLDRRLIDTDILSTAEIAWVDAYHARVQDEIGGRLDGEAQAWLAAATAPL